MTQEIEIKHNARRVVVLYRILEKEINRGSITGIALWSDALTDCMAHILVDNSELFKGA